MNPFKSNKNPTTTPLLIAPTPPASVVVLPLTPQKIRDGQWLADKSQRRQDHEETHDTLVHMVMTSNARNTILHEDNDQLHENNSQLEVDVNVLADSCDALQGLVDEGTARMNHATVTRLEELEGLAEQVGASIAHAQNAMSELVASENLNTDLLEKLREQNKKRTHEQREEQARSDLVAVRICALKLLLRRKTTIHEKLELQNGALREKLHRSEEKVAQLEETVLSHGPEVARLQGVECTALRKESDLKKEIDNLNGKAASLARRNDVLFKAAQLRDNANFKLITELKKALDETKSELAVAKRPKMADPKSSQEPMNGVETLTNMFTGMVFGWTEDTRVVYDAKKPRW